MPTYPTSEAQVERLHSLLAGDVVTEELVLQFIQAKWGARCLAMLPVHVADAIEKRPGEFLGKVKEAK